MEQYELDELAEKYRNVKCVDNGENLKDYIEHKLEIQRKEIIEKIKEQLIKNSQLSFDNNYIIFEREWFYQNVEEDFKLHNLKEKK